jgi:HSP20 family protein
MSSPFRFEFEPFDGLRRLQEELERAFEGPSWRVGSPSGRGVFPPVNVFGDAEGYVVRLDVPGLAPESVHLEAQGNTLRVSGKRDAGAAARGSLHRRERWSGEFSRSLQLPRELNLGRATASYQKGVLTIRIPRHEESKPRQIAVTSS